MKKTTIAIFLLTILIYIILYPNFLTISDETNYLIQGELITNGKLWHNNPEESYHHTLYNGHYTSKYSPLLPILLSVPLLISWKLIFAVNIILHLIGFFVFRKILRKLKINRVYALLYLLFPSLLFFSRTIMSETGTTVSLLIAFYLYISNKPKDHLASGFFFGIACLFRYPALIFFLSFLAVSFFKNRKKFINLIIGFIPTTIVILIYNYIIFGGFLTTGFNSGSPTTRNLTAYLTNVIKTYGHYILTLSIIYPLMIVSPFFYNKKYKLELVLTILSAILIFGFANNSIFRFSFAQNSIFSIRYILPIIPFLIICYSDFLDKLLNKLKLKKLLPIIFISILIISTSVIAKQQQLSTESERIMETIYENIPKNALIAGDVFSMRYVSPSFGPQKGMYLKNQYLYQESKNYPTYVIAVKEQRWLDTCKKTKLTKPEINCDLEELNINLKTKLEKTIKIDKNTLYIFKVIQ